MNYISIINLIFLIIYALLSIYLFHFIFFALSGLFHHKKYPISEKLNKYGLIISCKDEENVIPRLIDSIHHADYPQDKLDIIVIAHNCNDNTEKVARKLGARVIIDNNKEEKTLGCAYRYAFKQINVNEYDGFIFFNADNTLKKNFFRKMNDAFNYYNGENVITSFRHSLNMKEGILPCLYSYYFSTCCLLVFSGRNNFNVTGRITGCGFLIPSKKLVNGWDSISITEDIEYSTKAVLNGDTIHYCNEAIFYDEQPLDIKTMWFQRLRWSKGLITNSKTYFFKIFKTLFKKDHKNKMSLYTALTFSSFISLIYFFLLILQIGLLLLSPLFGISLSEAFLYWNYELPWYSNLFISLNIGGLYSLIKSIASFVIYSYLTALMVLISGHDKYKDAPIFKMSIAFILFPLFIFLQIPLDLTSLFIKNIKWRKVTHG